MAKVIEMNPSKINSGSVGGKTVLSLKNSLTHENCDQLESTITECIEQNKTEIMLDCKALAFLDSAALELLVRMHEELKKLSGSLKLISLNGVCRDILTATRLTNMFHLHEHIHEAMKREP